MPLLQLRQFSQIRLLWGWVILVSCKVVVGRFPWQILLRDKEHLLDMPSSRTNLCIVVQFLKIFSLFFTRAILIFCCPFELWWRFSRWNHCYICLSIYWKISQWRAIKKSISTDEKSQSRIHLSSFYAKWAKSGVLLLNKGGKSLKAFSYSKRCGDNNVGLLNTQIHMFYCVRFRKKNISIWCTFMVSAVGG